MTSKEAQNVFLRPPPRPAIVPPELAITVPLEQLWNRLPQRRRQELLGQLTRIVAQRLAPSPGKGAADE
jgi:hypothetical protein